MKELEGKTAVITGAASGLGWALAERLAGEGMNLVLADIEQQALASAAARLTDEGHAVLAVNTDVSQWDQVKSLADRSIQHFGNVHLLCNNAGVAVGGPIWELTLQDWEWVLGVDLWSVIYGIKAFVPHMRSHGEPAHVVNTASIAGQITVGGLAPYTTSKFGVVAISETLHHELTAEGSAVKVSVLCPGFVKTGIDKSDRNRPEALGETLTDNEDKERVQQLFTAFVEAGTGAAEIIDQVIDAIRAEQFWILPHRDLDPAIRSRMEAILQRQPPNSLIG
jgi:NAD(P)-dependent dehydrogenase (short-subunit alcohol dehydrogenase family)